MTQEELNSKRTRTEVYARVVGYIRPVANWNEGKKSELADRVMFAIPDEL